MNDYTKKYCKQFIESIESPHFALFINGKWGCGKTFFINNIINEYNEKTFPKKSEIIRISLFGVSKTDDIDKKLYQAIHPVLSSKEFKLIGNILCSAVKINTSIDLNKDGKDDLFLDVNNIPDTEKKKLNKLNKKILIIDDLERALMKPGQIFGCFSEIINDTDIRVIFIGNEDYLVTSLENEKVEYNQIKEKTIGAEYFIIPDIEEAMFSFMEKLEFTKTQKELIETTITRILQIIKCDNLRIIWQSLYNLRIFFSDLYNNVDDRDKERITEIFIMLICIRVRRN